MVVRQEVSDLAGRFGGALGDSVYLGAVTRGVDDRLTRLRNELRKGIRELLLGEGHLLQHVDGRASVVKPNELDVESQATPRLRHWGLAAAEHAPVRLPFDQSLIVGSQAACADV